MSHKLVILAGDGKKVLFKQTEYYNGDSLDRRILDIIRSLAYKHSYSHVSVHAYLLNDSEQMIEHLEFSKTKVKKK